MPAHAIEPVAPDETPLGKIGPILGWCVHGYTALGLVAAAGIALAIVRGTPSDFSWAFALMAIATFIDATDGTLARKVRIREVVPGFDGRRLDDIIDFLNYTFLPLLLLWRAKSLPDGQEAWLLLPLMASVYGFCQVSIKTSDGYFLGFPSLWNVVAFYIYALSPPTWLSLASLIFLGLLTFVPSFYLYPSSRRSRLNTLSNALGAVWAAVLIPGFWLMQENPESTAWQTGYWLVAVSLFYVIFYLGASWLVTLKHWFSPTP
ncbi:CDP-alcohol phosphatidyltransferase family protein [Isosphaeraceae bacterium EP7]